MKLRRPRKLAWLCLVVANGLLLYLGCFPFGVWMAWRWPASKPAVERLYFPVVRASVGSSESISGLIHWWGALLLHDPESRVSLSYKTSDRGRVIVIFRK